MTTISGIGQQVIAILVEWWWSVGSHLPANVGMSGGTGTGLHWYPAYQVQQAGAIRGGWTPVWVLSPVTMVDITP